MLGRLRQQFAQIQEAIVVRVSAAGDPRAGRPRRLRDAGRGPRRASAWPTLQQMRRRDRRRRPAAQTGLAALNTTFRAGVPQIYVDIDRVKVKTLGVPLSDVFGTLQAYLGSAYVNDFNKFGRTYQVRVQAEPEFRADARGHPRGWRCATERGEMVPLGTLVERARDDRPADHQPLQPLPAGVDHRRGRRRASARARR